MCVSVVVYWGVLFCFVFFGYVYVCAQLVPGAIGSQKVSGHLDG